MIGMTNTNTKPAVIRSHYGYYVSAVDGIHHWSTNIDDAKRYYDLYEAQMMVRHSGEFGARCGMVAVEIAEGK